MDSALDPEILPFDRPGFLIRRAHQITLSLFLDHFKDYGISPHQLGALICLLRYGAMKQIALAKLLGLDRSTMALVVGLLERRGLIAANPLPTDRRTKELAITAAGEEVVRGSRALLDTLKAEMMSVFTAAESAEFQRLLKKFNDGFNDRSRVPVSPPPAG